MLTFDEKGGPEDCPKTAKIKLRIIWMFQWHRTGLKYKTAYWYDV